MDRESGVDTLYPAIPLDALAEVITVVAALFLSGGKNDFFITN